VRAEQRRGREGEPLRACQQPDSDPHLGDWNSPEANIISREPHAAMLLLVRVMGRSSCTLQSKLGQIVLVPLDEG